MAARLAVHENPNAPSSTRAMFNAERNAFRNKRGSRGSDGAAKDSPKKKGPPAGHPGVSHSKPTHCIKYRLRACTSCDGPRLVRVRLSAGRADASARRGPARQERRGERVANNARAGAGARHRPSRGGDLIVSAVSALPLGALRGALEGASVYFAPPANEYYRTPGPRAPCPCASPYQRVASKRPRSAC